MASDYSFDIVSEVDMQVMDDVVNVAVKDLQNRFDLKGTGAEIAFDRGKKTITLSGPSEFVLKQVKDILGQKMTKRSVSPKVLQSKKVESASGGTLRENLDIVVGIEKELAKTMVKDIKASGLKVIASINDDIIRVSGKDKDELQKVIRLIKEKDYPIDVQFKNYR